MFSISMHEQGALQALFTSYETHRGTLAGVLCQKVGIELAVRERSPLNGCRDPFFGFFGYENKKPIVTVSADAWSLLRQFIVYHEVAHSFLDEYDWVGKYVRLGNTGRKYRLMECWCDAFATAMLLSCEGFEMVSGRGYVEFFNAGVPDEVVTMPLNDFSLSNACFEGKRIMGLSKNMFNPAHGELFFLGKQLVADAEKKFKKAAV